MSRDLVKIKADFSAFEDMLPLIQGNEQRIKMAVAATIQTNRAMMFANDGAYNGHPAWEPLKFRQGQPLQDRGDLRNSIAPKTQSHLEPSNPGPGGYIRYAGDVSRFSTEVGTELIYARIHDQGGTVVPKNAHALRFKGPNGKWMFRKRVTIPKRNFTDWNEVDDEEVAQTLAGVIESILSEGLTDG